MSRNPSKRCRICGGKCKANVRFCALCARDRKNAAGAKEVQRDN